MADDKPKPRNKSWAQKGELPEHLREHCFQKGQSGNAPGRPKGSFGLMRSLARMVDEPNTDKRGQGLTWGESLARMLFHKAANEGSVRAAEAILDRLLGKPIQATLSGEMDAATREQHIERVREALRSLGTDATSERVN